MQLWLNYNIVTVQHPTVVSVSQILWNQEHFQTILSGQKALKNPMPLGEKVLPACASFHFFQNVLLADSRIADAHCSLIELLTGAK